MDHGIGPEPAHRLTQRDGVADIGLHQMAPADQIAMAAREIVIDHHLMARPRDELAVWLPI